MFSTSYHSRYPSLPIEVREKTTLPRNPTNQISALSTDLPQSFARISASGIVSMHTLRGREFALNLISGSLHLISVCPLSISSACQSSFSLSVRELRFGKPNWTNFSDLNVVNWDTETAAVEQSKEKEKPELRDWGDEREHGFWELNVKQLRSEGAGPSITALLSTPAVPLCV